MRSRAVSDRSLALVSSRAQAAPSCNSTSALTLPSSGPAKAGRATLFRYSPLRAACLCGPLMSNVGRHGPLTFVRTDLYGSLCLRARARTCACRASATSVQSERRSARADGSFAASHRRQARSANDSVRENAALPTPCKGRSRRDCTSRRRLGKHVLGLLHDSWTIYSTHLASCRRTRWSKTLRQWNSGCNSTEGSTDE